MIVQWWGMEDKRRMSLIMNTRQQHTTSTKNEVLSLPQQDLLPALGFWHAQEESIQTLKHEAHSSLLTSIRAFEWILEFNEM